MGGTSYGGPDSQTTGNTYGQIEHMRWQCTGLAARGVRWGHGGMDGTATIHRQETVARFAWMAMQTPSRRPTDHRSHGLGCSSVRAASDRRETSHTLCAESVMPA